MNKRGAFGDSLTCMCLLCVNRKERWALPTKSPVYWRAYFSNGNSHAKTVLENPTAPATEGCY